MTRSAIIVGAGIGGLSSAALLAEDGWDVTVLERNDRLGGRARQWEHEGFTFDMGPSWYLMPEVFDRFFAELGSTPAKEYDLTRLDPSYRLFFGGEDVIDVPATLEETYALFERLEKGGAARLKHYLDIARHQYEVSMDEFLYKEYKSLLDFFTPRMLTEGAGLHVFRSLERHGKKMFRSDRARKIVQYTTVFLGGSPRNTPALYAMMAHVDMNLGVWYPRGGLGAVVEAITRHCEKRGVRLLTGVDVSAIECEDGVARRVVAGDDSYEADVIICNADYHHVETQLLDKRHRSLSQRYWDRRISAPSGFCIYLGVEGRLDSLQHHNLFLDNDWEQHFREVFERPAWPDNPSYYVCAPSRTDASVAPAGDENLFILVPIAAGLEDTPRIRKDFSRQILTHLSELTGEDISKRARFSRTFSINDFSRDYNAFRGTALGLAHTLRQSAIFRPSPRSKRVRNLYYVGADTRPGIGVPMVIISAHNLREMLR